MSFLAGFGPLYFSDTVGAVDTSKKYQPMMHASLVFLPSKAVRLSGRTAPVFVPETSSARAGVLIAVDSGKIIRMDGATVVLKG